MSDSLVISMLVWDSPFLYSMGQSKSRILGFFIYLLIAGCTMSLLTMTPSRTRQSSKRPPGIFSTLAYLLTSKVSLEGSHPERMILTDLIARSTMRLFHLAANLVPMQDWSAPLTSSSLLKLMGMAISSRILSPS